MEKEKHVHVYLAGPDVFARDAVALGERKKAFLASLGLVGHYPLDNEIALGDDPARAARQIADANEAMILACCEAGGRAALLANMTPFRSPFMDGGTAFEVGFMSALARRFEGRVMMAGYTDDLRPAEVRVAQDLFGGQVETCEGRLMAPDGMAIEAFGLVENLMMTSAIERCGGKIFATFEEAARFVGRWASKGGRA